MKDQTIYINWTPALPLNDAIASDLSNTHGLYYITRVFGKKETSLYVGIATRNNTIRHRLYGHRSSWLPQYRGKFFVRMGHILYPRYYDINDEQNIIQHAESAIIYEHKDILIENYAKCQTYTYTGLYRIENIGDHYELKSTIRMHDQE